MQMLLKLSRRYLLFFVHTLRFLVLVLILLSCTLKKSIFKFNASVLHTKSSISYILESFLSLILNGKRQQVMSSLYKMELGLA